MRHACKLIVITLLSIALQVSAGERADNTPFFLQFTQGASAAAGIGELRATPLAENEQEIRIWVGFGVLRVDRMLRLKVDPSGKVRGEVLVHYKNDLGSMSPGDAAEFRRSVLAGCTNSKSGTESNVCTATYRREPNWQSICKKLVKLGLLDLPDESALPAREMDINDGVAMVVELRRGSHYRAYEYSNSWARTEPQAVAATKIMQVVGKTMGAADGT